MNGRNHLISSVALGVVSATVLQIDFMPTGCVFIQFCVLGGVLPDLDCPTSKVGRILPTVSKAIKYIFGHRGFMHTPCFIMICIIIYVISQSIYSFENYNVAFLGLMIGYSWHILCDSFTKAGIRMFYPLSKKTLSFTWFKSGKKGELVVALLLLVLIVSLFYYLQIYVPNLYKAVINSTHNFIT